MCILYEYNIFNIIIILRMNFKCKNPYFDYIWDNGDFTPCKHG